MILMLWGSNVILTLCRKIPWVGDQDQPTSSEPLASNMDESLGSLITSRMIARWRRGQVRFEPLKGRQQRRDESLQEHKEGLVFAIGKKQPIRKWRDLSESERQTFMSQYRTMTAEANELSQVHLWTGLPEPAQKSRNLPSRDGDTRIFEIPCQLAQHPANALGDYGAKRNFLRESFAMRLGLAITRSASCLVTVGSGRQVATVGTTTVPFKFRKEQTEYPLKFHILPDCIHDVIVGKRFLKLTETFSNMANYGRRVEERVVRGISRFRFLYLGASSSMILGTVNGQPHTALADSGSKILAMDKTYAQAIGVKIETGHHHRRRVIFADNSVAETVGMAYNVEWRFGHDNCFSSPHQLDFHILRSAPADVILSDTFLFDNKAFSQYQHCFIDDDEDFEDEDIEAYFFAIDIDKRKEQLQCISTKIREVHSFSDSNLLANQRPYTLADLQHLEVVRRGEEADRISKLSGTERTAVQDAEDQRIAEWDQEFAIMQENGQSKPSVAYLLASKSDHKTKRHLPTLVHWLRRRSQGASKHELAGS